MSSTTSILNFDAHGARPIRSFTSATAFPLKPPPLQASHPFRRSLDPSDKDLQFQSKAVASERRSRRRNIVLKEASLDRGSEVQSKQNKSFAADCDKANSYRIIREKALNQTVTHTNRNYLRNIIAQSKEVIQKNHNYLANNSRVKNIIANPLGNMKILHNYTADQTTKTLSFKHSQARTIAPFQYSLLRVLQPKGSPSPSRQKSCQKNVGLDDLNIELTSSFIFDSASRVIPDCTSIASKQQINFEYQTQKKEAKVDNGLKDEDFARLRFLGRGKFGQVFLVRHKSTNFICAMKIISKSTVRSENVIHQISRQLKIHNSLHHSNIVPFYGYFASQNSFHILLEYATGGQLYSKLKACHRMEEVEAKGIVRGVAEGLRMMHCLGYIHRDIKPQNLVLQFGTVKICDLGWAAACSSHQTRSSYCGTPLYLSPQIIRKQHYNSQTDIWSLGLLTYELIVGRFPFKVFSQFDLNQIVNSQIVFPDYVDMTDDSKDFIRKCLQKMPQMRIKVENVRKHKFLEEGGDGYFNASLYQDVQRIMAK